MSFRRMLIHRCTLIQPGVETGRDDYNRPIYEDVVTTNVPCRADQVKRMISRDDKGTNVITEDVLFLLPTQTINDQMKVQDIKDLDGNVVLDGTFTIENTKPIYNRARLHHYEATLKKGE